jgi:hypothetical protein
LLLLVRVAQVGKADVLTDFSDEDTALDQCLVQKGAKATSARLRALAVCDTAKQDLDSLLLDVR